MNEKHHFKTKVCSKCGLVVDQNLETCAVCGNSLPIIPSEPGVDREGRLPRGNGKPFSTAPLAILGLFLLIGVPALWNHKLSNQDASKKNLKQIEQSQAEWPIDGPKVQLARKMTKDRAYCIRVVSCEKYDYFLLEYRERSMGTELVRINKLTNQAEPIGGAKHSLQHASVEDIVRRKDGSLAMLTSVYSRTAFDHPSDAKSIAADISRDYVMNPEDSHLGGKSGYVSTLFTIKDPNNAGLITPSFHSIVNSKPSTERVRESRLLSGRSGGLLCLHNEITTGWDPKTHNNILEETPNFFMPAGAKRWASPTSRGPQPGGSRSDRIVYGASAKLGIMAFDGVGLWSFTEEAPYGWALKIGPGWVGPDGQYSDTSGDDHHGYQLFVGEDVWTQHSTRIYHWKPGENAWLAIKFQDNRQLENGVSAFNTARAGGEFGVDARGNFHIGIHVMDPNGKWNDTETAPFRKGSNVVLAVEPDGSIFPVVNDFTLISEDKVYRDTYDSYIAGEKNLKALFPLVMLCILIGGIMTASSAAWAGYGKNRDSFNGRLVTTIILSIILVCIVGFPCLAQMAFRGAVH